MEHPNLNVPCPTCGAEPGERCRTLKTRRTTDTHNARWNQSFYLQERQSQDEQQAPPDTESPLEAIRRGALQVARERGAK